MQTIRTFQRQNSRELTWLLSSLVAWNLSNSSSSRCWSRFPKLSGSNTKRNPLDIAEWIVSELSHELNSDPFVHRSTSSIFNRPDTYMTPASWQRLRRWIHQRTVQQKPLQYILGTQPFGGLEIAVRPPVLIPRWETEEWSLHIVDNIVKHSSKRTFPPVFRILDLCSGSGCISLLIASHLQKNFPATKFEVVMCDISKSALLLSGVNARKAGFEVELYPSDYPDVDRLSSSFLSSSRMKVVGILGSVFDSSLSEILNALVPCRSNFSSGFHLVVSNPPYIPAVELQFLDPSVKDWEDHRALISGESGDDAILKVLDIANKTLMSKTESKVGVYRVFIEVNGEEQAIRINSHINNSGIWTDGTGIKRAVYGT